VSASVIALTGCWAGQGEVMGKPVAMAIAAKPIVQDAMLALDAESSAIEDPKDRYSAHLIFGGGEADGAGQKRIVGFWADSFGGAFAALGDGESRADGFDISYRYPDDEFINRWRVLGDRLTWQIVARDKQGAETRFATYSLGRVECPGSAAKR